MSIVTPYEDLLRFVLETGTPKSDRTGTGTRSLFGQQMRYDLSAGFPLLTTKKVHFKSVAYELLWFLRGDSNIGWLHEHGVTIWDEWASDTGELGPIYGVQWRSWPAPSGEHIDQISAALDLLRTDPDSRRIIVSAWNVGEIERMALPPCHAFFQFYVADGRLSCQLYQRSADLFLGPTKPAWPRRRIATTAAAAAIRPVSTSATPTATPWPRSPGSRCCFVAMTSRIPISGPRAPEPRLRYIRYMHRGYALVVCSPGVTRTMIDIDDDLLARAAKELGTTTKKDTVHAALRAALRASAARSLMNRMAENATGTQDEALVNAMWRDGHPENTA